MLSKRACRGGCPVHLFLLNVLSFPLLYVLFLSLTMSLSTTFSPFRFPLPIYHTGVILFSLLEAARCNYPYDYEQLQVRYQSSRSYLFWQVPRSWWGRTATGWVVGQLRTVLLL